MVLTYSTGVSDVISRSTNANKPGYILAWRPSTTPKSTQVMLWIRRQGEYVLIDVGRSTDEGDEGFIILRVDGYSYRMRCDK